MPRTQGQWIKLLGAAGWRQETGGRHQVKMTMPGRRPITLPDNHRRPYAKGFEAQLRREARLSGDLDPARARIRGRGEREREAGR